MDSLDLGTQERSEWGDWRMDGNGGKGRELPPFVQCVKVTKHSRPCLHVAITAPPSRAGICPGARREGPPTRPPRYVRTDAGDSA